jgi:RNA polymerase sigma-70 factor (ECF subfamily)
MTTSMAGVSTLADLATAIGIRTEEAAVIAELKAGSEEAYAWLIAQFHQPVYSLVYRIVNDPADAADTTQEVFIKVFRGMRRFNGASSLKTWIYRIAVHEASNQRRWWSRHKSRETSMEPPPCNASATGLKDILIDDGISPFDSTARSELRTRIERELREVPEPYRTAVVLRDIEELSYEEVAEITETNLGTVKSRIVRGREALRKRLQTFIDESRLFHSNQRRGVVGVEPNSHGLISCGPEVEVTP